MNTIPEITTAFEEFKATSAPVFLFGNNRGGTTMLHNMVNLHPEVFKLGRNTYFIDQIWKYRRLLPEKMLHRLFLGAQIRESLPRPEQQELFYLLGRIFSGLWKERNPSDLLTFYAFAQFILQEQGAPFPKLWVEKTNSHIFHFRTLAQWFPGARFVSIVRDPRANAASAYKVDHKRGISPSEQRATMSSATTWVIHNTFIRDMQRAFPSQSLVLRYEELVSDPTGQIARVFAFLDLPPMEQDALQAGVETFGNVKPSNIGVQRSAGIDTSSMERWRELLSPYQLEVIATIAAPLARKFGYTQEERGAGLRKLSQDSWGVYLRRLAWLAMDKTGAWKLVRPLVHR